MDTNTNTKTLLESLGAVQAALHAMPEAGPRSLREAFSLSDPVLATLDKQLADARQNLTKLANAFGLGDAMGEAIQIQIAALEAAYAQRVAALRKAREDRERKTARNVSYKKAPAKMFACKENARRKRERRERDDWFLLWALLLMDDRKRPKISAPVLKAA